MRKYCWYAFIISLFLIILSPVWAEVEKIPTSVGAEYKIKAIKVDHKAIDKNHYGLKEQRFFTNSNFSTFFGFQIQLDPFDKKREIIEMLIYLRHYWAERIMGFDYVLNHIRVMDVKDHRLSFSYQKLEMQAGTGKTYLLKKIDYPFRTRDHIPNYPKDFDLEYFRIDRTDFEEILKEGKLTFNYTVNDKQTLILTFNDISKLAELNRIAKADPYWAYCQPGSEKLPPLQRPTSLQEQSDLLTPLLGKKFSDPEIQQTLYQLGGKKPKSAVRSYDEFDYVDYNEDRGLGFYFYDKILKDIEIHKSYVGVLPFDINFNDRRENVRQNFGLMINSTTNTDTWDIDKYRLEIYYYNDSPSRLNIRLLSYQSYKFPNQTPVDPEKQKLLPADLGTLYGTSFTDPAMSNYLNILGQPEVSKEYKEFFYRFPLNCTYITDQDKKIIAVDFSRELVNGVYRYYPGVLPHGLHWDDTRTDVERKLGKTGEIRVVKGEPIKAIYKLPSSALHIEYQQDPSNREIQVMRKIFIEFKPTIQPTTQPTTKDMSKKTLVRNMEFPVSKFAISPDGKIIASANNLWLMLWETGSGKLLAKLGDHSNQILSVTYSPDGKTIASGSMDKTAKIWNEASGKLWLTLSGHSQAVSSITFSPDNLILATGSWDKTVKLWDPVNGKLLATLTGPTNLLCNIAFSPDGKTIAGGSADNKIYLWNVAGGKLVQTLKGHSGPVMFLTFSPDGRSIASGSLDQTVKIWDVVKGEPQKTLTGHLDGILTVAFSPDGKTIVSGGYLKDKSIKVWDVASGKLITTFIGHDDAVGTVAFLPNSNTIISGSLDKTMKLWDLPNNQE